MPAFNLKCPKGYGEITFIEREQRTPKMKVVVCPISSTKDCVDCDVIRWASKKEGQVTRVAKK